MTVLNTADAIRLGTSVVDRVYLGANQVWAPAAAGLPVTAGLIGHYDAGDPANFTLSGNLVDVWSDLSGAGNHLTASGAQRPIYDATNKCLLLDKQKGDTVDQKVLVTPAGMHRVPKAVFFVLDPPTKSATSWAAYQDLIGYPGTGGLRLATHTGTRKVWHTIAGVPEVYINGVASSTTVDAVFPLPSRFVLWANDAAMDGTFSRLFNKDSPTQQWEGNAYEVLIYNRVLTAQEVTDLTSYLYAKHGITP